MKKTIITTAIIVVISITALMVFARAASKRDKADFNFAAAQKGNFEIAISGTGNLDAEFSSDIKGPNIVKYRMFRASPLKITDLIPEGTIVQKGDYVATLDKSTYENLLKDELTKLTESETNLHMKILDTAVVLTELRDDIRNQRFTVEEADITVQQSKYEPPAVQREAELNRDKERRALDWKRNLYTLRRAQCKLDIKNLITENRIQMEKVNDIRTVIDEFSIKAPADGMVIYKKDRMGVKVQLGSVLNPFDPVVATLPDLSSLMSKIYVSEIDIRKIKKGLPVQITIDAFKGKTYTGKVNSIANIGEQLYNADTKVFEVLVKLDHSDPSLRPSMTTNNKIIVKTFNNVVYVPLESVHAGTDSIPFVYTKDGSRQVVIPGEANDKNIIIEKGLAEGTTVYLDTPENVDSFKLTGKELIGELRDNQRALRLEDEKIKPEIKVLADELKTDNISLKPINN
jgi:HlyD family secretion protein